MKTGIKVSEAMTEKPVTIDKSTNLMDCANVMRNNHVGALIVKDSEDTVGIVTEKDFVRKAVTEDKKMSETPVESIMAKILWKIGPDNDIRDAIKKMATHSVRHMPVFNGEEFLGLLTSKDILKIEPSLFEILAAHIELKEESRKPINNIHEEEGICHECGKYSEIMYEKDGTLVCKDCRE